jgi:uncharacterized protein
MAAMAKSSKRIFIMDLWAIVEAVISGEFERQFHVIICGQVASADVIDFAASLDSDRPNGLVPTPFAHDLFGAHLCPRPAVARQLSFPRSPMPERVFIIHGYLGYPEEAWQPWLKAELEKRGYAVALPAMPHPDRPTISEWVAFITRLVGQPDEKTVMIGHSLGAQAVLRYLEALGANGQSVGKTVLIASGFPSGMSPEAADQKSGGDPTLRAWLSIGVDPGKVKKAAGTCTVILSVDDPYIPFEEAKASFQTNLGPKIIVETGKGHFNEDDDIVELPSALEAVLS